MIPRHNIFQVPKGTPMFLTKPSIVQSASKIPPAKEEDKMVLLIVTTL
jgi:hypothetical protein